MLPGHLLSPILTSSDPKSGDGAGMALAVSGTWVHPLACKEGEGRLLRATCPRPRDSEEFTLSES